MRRVLAILLVLAAPCAAFADPPSRAASFAEQAASSATLAGQRLLRLLDQTRLARDRERTACVDRELAVVNSFGRRILERRERLLAAEQRGDRAEARYQSLVIRTLLEQLRRAEREGRACIDAQANEPGSTVVTVVREAGLPHEDPSVLTEADRLRR
jgi:hypothetical protein